MQQTGSNLDEMIARMAEVSECRMHTKNIPPRASETYINHWIPKHTAPLSYISQLLMYIPPKMSFEKKWVSSWQEVKVTKAGQMVIACELALRRWRRESQSC